MAIPGPSSTCPGAHSTRPPVSPSMVHLRRKAMSSYRPVITATGLRNSYGGKLVLGGIDRTVTEGMSFALLGPDGAGKNTAEHILSMLIGADGGEARSRPTTLPAGQTPSGTRSASLPVLRDRRPAHRRGKPALMAGRRHLDRST